MVPSLDACLNEVFREEQWLFTRAVMEQQKSTSVLMAYVAHGKPRGRDISNVQCFCCKGIGHCSWNCSKKFCNDCKKDGHIIKECPARRSKKSPTAYIDSVGSSSISGSLDAATLTQSAPTPVQTVAPEIIQQIIFFAFSALGLSGNPSSTSTWHYGSRASNHMTNNA